MPRLSRRKFLRLTAVGAAGLAATAYASASPALGASAIQAAPTATPTATLTAGGSPAAPASSTPTATRPPFNPDVEMTITASPREVQIGKGKPTQVWSYTAEVVKGDPSVAGTIPGSYLGPVLRLRKGQKVRILFRNNLPEPSIIHWHGLLIPSDMDGQPRSQVEAGKTFTYEFEVVNRAGAYLFHPHPHRMTASQVMRGLAGLLLISDDEEGQLGLPQGAYDLPLVIQDRTFDADNQILYLGGQRVMDTIGQPAASMMGGGMMGSGMMAGGGMMNGTPGAMMSGTPGPMMSGTPGRMMNGTPGAMMSGTPGTMMGGTPGAIMKGTPGAIMSGTPGAMMNGTPGAMMNGTPGAMMNSGGMMANGQMATMMGQMMGFLGETILVNGQPDFVLPVATNVYRLRVYNASNSRMYKLAWSDSSPMVVIATDGGLLPRPVERPYITLGPGERMELWADFSKKKVGDEITLRSLEFVGADADRMMGGMSAGAMGMGAMGMGAMGMGAMPMACMDGMSSQDMQAMMDMYNNYGGKLPNGSAFDVLKVRVERQEKPAAILPKVLSTVEPLKPANADFPRFIGLQFSHIQWQLNGRTFDIDDVNPAEIVRLGTVEAWEFVNERNPGMMMHQWGMVHPMHIHGVQFQVLNREVYIPELKAGFDSVAEGYVDEGWKDTVSVMPGTSVRVAMRFTNPGRYLYHCHNLEHEDGGMMRNFQVDT